MKFPGLYVVFLILSIVATVIGLCLSIFSVYSPAWQVVELREFQAEHQVAVATFFFGLNCHARILFKEHFFFFIFFEAWTLARLCPRYASLNRCIRNIRRSRTTLHVQVRRQCSKSYIGRYGRSWCRSTGTRAPSFFRSLMIFPN